MSMTMEQVLTQLQQELFTLRAQSGCKIWTRRCSASEQQARDSSSSERYSESHRCEKALVVRRNSLVERGIFNSGRRRRRHSSLV